MENEHHNIDKNLGAASVLADNLLLEFPNESVLPEHLFLAIVREKSSIFQKIMDALEVRSTQLEGELIRHLSNNAHERKLTKKKQTWHEHTNIIVQDAQSVMEELEDDSLGVEHVLCSLARVSGTPTYKILNKLGLKADLVVKALFLVRGSLNHKSNQGIPHNNVSISEETTKNNTKGKTESGSETSLGVDLTNLAEEGLLDPVIGRDIEIRRILNILTRRTKNNPLLLGEAGVGKTAIAEGLASKIIAGDVPMSLRGFRIINIDVGSLVADTGVRGEFEKRLNQLIETAMSSAKNIILFIDEIHLLVGAGTANDSSLDAGNILKPYLARGLIRCVGATTYSEYTKYIEKDPALARRFQKVIVKEPSVNESISILRGLRDKYEGFHGIRIKDSALVSAAELSSRYITDRQLPDKAVDLVDEAASRKRMEIDSTPKVLDEISQKLIHLELERASLAKDTNGVKSNRLEKLTKKIETLENRGVEILDQWNNTRDELNFLSLLKQRIENLKGVIASATKESDFRLAAEIEHLELEPLLEKLETIESNKNSTTKNFDSVTEEDIAKVISELTGIPITQLENDESKTLLSLEEEINKQVIGQAAAVEAVCRSIKISRTNLSNPDKPIGTFMFLGPTGVGKTELAKAVSRKLFNSKSSFIRLDMSEYFDKYTVSRLIGASPGYIGFEDGGQLTEAVRKKPYSCILFDEIEKAHSDIYNILLQILDEGRLTDSRGRTIDFTNTVIILTSNSCADQINTNFKKQSPRKKAASTNNPKQISKSLSSGIDKLDRDIKSELLKTFKPELLNRIDDIILFTPLLAIHIEQIVKIEIEVLNKRLKKSGKQLIVSPDSLKFLANKVGESDYGARPVGRMIKSYIQAPLSELMLGGKFAKSKSIYVHPGEKDTLEFSTQKPKGKSKLKN